VIRRHVAPAALLLILLSILASPAAADITLNSAGVVGSQTLEMLGSNLDADVSEIGSGYGIVEIYIHEVSPGTNVSFTLSRSNGDTWSGSYQYTISGVTGNVTRNFGDLSASQEFISIIPIDNSFWIGYASDSDANSRGIALADVGSDPSDALYIPISYIDSLPITRIQLSTDTGDEIRIFAHYASASAISQHINEGSTPWLDQLLEAADGFLVVVLTLFAAFKFVFLDHFLAIIVLFESITLAYAASQSNGFIPFVQKFWRYNEAFVFFILKFMSYVMNFFYRIIQAIKPI